jgi:MFS transporter, PAT family, beta-lactamase induction signal transducer AmpG
LIPSGISQGFVSITLPYLFTQKGFSVELSAGIVAFGLSANIWRFATGPLADATLSLKKWYGIALAATIITLMALCVLPYNNKQTATLYLLVFLSQLAATLTVLPVSSIMAHRIKEEEKGLASGWFQAGSLGGTGIGGGIGLWLATHYNITIAAIVVSICMLLCCWPLYKIADVVVDKSIHFTKQLKEVFIDSIAMLKTPLTLFVMFLVMSPIGSGAASYLWSAVGKDWHADADTIALSSGIISGLLSALGSIAGGWICDKWNVFTGYFFAGTICALVTIVMALCSYTPVVFIGGVLLYAFALGLCYSAFSATLLFAIGKKSAATRYAVLASLGNISVVYMTALDGRVHDAYNSKIMLLFESFAGLVFVGICIIVVKWMRGRMDL